MSSAATIDGINWSNAEYTMREFVEQFSLQLPALCLTRTGYSGYDEDMHQIGASEVYWVYAIQRQKRIVATQENQTSYISIPVDYPLKAQIIYDGKLSHAISMQNILEQMINSSNSIKIQFENNRSVSFQVGADFGNTTKFGDLEVEDSYEEKYLLAYAIHGGELFSKTIGIPVYLDITISTAEGLKDGHIQSFNKWMKELKAIIKDFESTPLKMCQEIIVFPQRPSSGHYEYVKPTLFANLPQSSTGKYSVGRASQQPSKDERKNIYETHPEKNKSLATHEKQVIVSKKLPPFPRRAPPPFPGQKEIGCPGKGTQPNSKPQPSDQKAPPLPSSRRRNNPPDSHICLRDNPYENATATPKLLQSPEITLNQPHYEHLVDVRTSIDVFKSPQDVPINFCFDKLSIDGVCKLLELVKMNEYSSTIKEKQVDGTLLMQMDEKMLVESFEFTSFDAKKLLMFLKDEWRPKK